MKKNYIMPQLQMHKIALQQMIAESIGIGPDGGEGEKIDAEVRRENSWCIFQ